MQLQFLKCTITFGNRLLIFLKCFSKMQIIIIIIIIIIKLFNVA